MAAPKLKKNQIESISTNSGLPGVIDLNNPGEMKGQMLTNPGPDDLAKLKALSEAVGGMVQGRRPMPKIKK